MNAFSAICDIAEATKLELGPHVTAYSGSEIEKELKKRSAIMYTTEQQDGHIHIKLSSDKAQALKLSFNEMYG